MAVAEEQYGNIELQEQDDDDIYANIEIKTTPTAQEKDSQILQSDIRRYRRIGECFGLLCAVLALISIAGPVYLYLSNMVEKKQLQARNSILTEEQGQCQTSFDQLKTTYNHLTEQKEQLQTSFDCMKRTLCEPHGFTYGDGLCYYISTEKKNWEESRQWCRDRRSDLIVIKSEEKQDFVKRNKMTVWLGLTDQASEQSFKWVDGTPLTTPTYWESSQPNNAALQPYTEQDCVEFLANGWNDRSCLVTNNWICERVLC